MVNEDNFRLLLKMYDLTIEDDTFENELKVRLHNFETMGALAFSLLFLICSPHIERYKEFLDYLLDSEL
jgi:hypothetical protein